MITHKENYSHKLNYYFNIFQHYLIYSFLPKNNTTLTSPTRHPKRRTKNPKIILITPYKSSLVAPRSLNAIQALPCCLNQGDSLYQNNNMKNLNMKIIQPNHQDQKKLNRGIYTSTWSHILHFLTGQGQKVLFKSKGESKHNTDHFYCHKEISQETRHSKSENNQQKQ